MSSQVHPGVLPGPFEHLNRPILFVEAHSNALPGQSKSATRSILTSYQV